jgi:hypothetical protein
VTRRIDLQVHTDASPCSGTAPEAIVEAALAADLDGIVVTDHDTTANVDRVQSCAPPMLEVISGVEVTTTAGHMLAVGVESPPPQADPVRVAEWVHERGGVAVLSHPFDRLRQTYRENLSALATAVDGVEVANSRCLLQQFNREASSFAAANGLAETGGSDGHFPFEIGRCVTAVEDEHPVTEAIRRGETTADGHGGYLSGHVATKLHQWSRTFR